MGSPFSFNHFKISIGEAVKCFLYLIATSFTESYWPLTYTFCFSEMASNGILDVITLTYYSINI